LEARHVHVLWELGPLNAPSGGDPLVLSGVVRRPGSHADVPVVVKLVPPDKASGVAREMQLRERLAHRGASSAAVPLHSVAVRGGAVAVVMHRASSDLFHAVDGVVGAGDSPAVVAWMQQTAAAVAELHASGIAHRDLKPENVLLFPAARSPEDTVRAAQLDWEDSSMYPGEAPLALQLYATTGAVDAEVRYTAALCDFEFATVRPSALDDAGGAHPHAMLATAPYGTDAYTPPESYGKVLLQNRPVKYFEVWTPGTRRVYSKKARGYVRHAPRSRAADVPEHVVASRELAARYDCAAADVWAFGVAVYVLCTDGAYPFKAACPSRARFSAFMRRYYTQHTRGGAVFAGGRQPAWRSAAGDDWVWPTRVPHGARHLLVQCWHPDPSSRPPMQQVAAHPWLHDLAWMPHSAEEYAQYAVPKSRSTSPVEQQQQQQQGARTARAPSGRGAPRRKAGRFRRCAQQ